MISEEGILTLYRLWSEEYFSASFMSPSPDIIKMFRNWVKALDGTYSGKNLEDYEKSMIMEYLTQEHNNDEV